MNGPTPDPTGDPADWLPALAAGRRRCFWLDGGGGRDWSGRRSHVGWLTDDDVSLSYDAAAREVTRHAGGRAEVVGDDPFAVLEHELATGAADAQWFGYFGYAARPDLPAHPSRRDGAGLPDAVWMRPSRVLVLPGHPGAAAPPGVRPTPPDLEVPASYRAAFARVQEHLHAGNTYEVNLTHRVTARSDLTPAAAYLRLRAANPAPYAGFVQHDVPGAEAWLLSSSPERYAVVGADRTVETRPIKGTTPRGATPAEDARARAELATHPRFRAENLMVLDLLRNDLSMVCEPGSVEVPHLLQVESYAAVHQLVSTVRGRLRPEVSALAALRALFPAGSMTGAPKLRTMEVIAEVETTPRGAYAGAFGRIGADGTADLGVVIRSLTTTGDGAWRLGTGGGVTVHSEVASEHAEAGWKAARVLDALTGSRSTPPD
ncbi:anthranilate synthase component I family protein [Nocardioides sp. dk4132]|uniref:anthranilate synthase component I family protein n=1 Tax=unclassified Nocardioides TaxID=2615069 RepID=UPI001296BDF1|nr:MULTISPECIES: anthranilate synthase component I family protein [unclassified Nocardioides]MQW76921.1 anthranilate synthase component I family protein [Nocardioides sp. dk4132]QGA09343.1 anthranilate synthase component I family protein [Nocardioides sp. dk884]